MKIIQCPDCGNRLQCVDSYGVWWRCYGHGERTYDMSENAEAQAQAGRLRAQSASNAAVISRGGSC